MPQGASGVFPRNHKACSPSRTLAHSLTTNVSIAGRAREHGASRRKWCGRRPRAKGASPCAAQTCAPILGLCGFASFCPFNWGVAGGRGIWGLVLRAVRGWPQGSSWVWVKDKPLPQAWPCGSVSCSWGSQAIPQWPSSTHCGVRGGSCWTLLTGALFLEH